MNLLSELELQVMRALRDLEDLSDPVGPDWMEKFAIDLTSLGGHTVLTLLVIIAVGGLLLDGRRIAARLLLGSTAGAMLLSAGLKQLIDRARPDVVEHLVHVSTPSFPSGHALLSASIYLTLAVILGQQYPKPVLRRYLLVVAATLTLLVGFSRVYLGVHWPTDVLAGWLVGSLWAWGCWRMARKQLHAPMAQA